MGGYHTYQSHGGDTADAGAEVEDAFAFELGAREVALVLVLVGGGGRKGEVGGEEAGGKRGRKRGGDGGMGSEGVAILGTNSLTFSSHLAKMMDASQTEVPWSPEETFCLTASSAPKSVRWTVFSPSSLKRANEWGLSLPIECRLYVEGGDKGLNPPIIRQPNPGKKKP